MPPYSANNDQPPLIPLFHGGDEPLIPPYNRPMTAQYFEVMRERVAPHVLPNTSTVPGGDYSVLRREEREVS